MKTVDICVIGSGMAGISAALYLKRANVNFVILEGTLAGGMLNKLKTVENFPAAGKTSGSEILINLMDQLRFNGIQITYGNVQTILKEGDGFEVVTDVESYDAKTVIVCTGNSQVSSVIPGEEKYSGSGVSYCATCDGNFFKGLDVAVVGNNNICLEEAIYLSGLVNKLYFVCPDGEISGDNDLVNKIKKLSNIEFIMNSSVDEIVGDDFGVTGIKVGGKIIEISGVFPYIGKKTPTQILNNLKPEMVGNFVKVNEDRMSNIPGLYAAGDIANNKLKQLVTAASDGAIAATNAINYCKLKG